jgi:hypothetical protein
VIAGRGSARRDNRRHAALDYTGLDATSAGCAWAPRGLLDEGAELA